MADFEAVVPNQLYIARETLPDEAAAIAASVADLPNLCWPTGRAGLVGTDRIVGRTQIGIEGGCEHRSFRGRPEFASGDLDGIDKITEHRVFMAPTRFQVIRQGAWFQQGAHRDVGTEPPIDSLHLSPNGGFEYEQDGVMRLLKASTGDIVRITDLSLRHRGLNLGHLVRYTLQLYRQIGDNLPIEQSL